MGSSTSQAADENELRSLLGLGSQSPSYNKISPAPYHQQPQQLSSTYGTYSPVWQQQASLAKSQNQRPQQHQPAIEPLAPRPQKLAQFDSLDYEGLVPPPTFTHQSSQQAQGTHHQMQPQHPPPPPHFTHHHHHQPPPNQQQHSYQRQAPASATSQQQQFVSAPLMPSVLLNKNQTSGASPPVQPRGTAPQPQTSSSYGGQSYGSHQVPQYSPTSSGFQKYGPPPVLRVKSPLSQSHTYGYASSEYSSSDPRVGAQSIPPPPVPPVESRPPHAQQQQQVPRRSSGDRVQQALSPRVSPQGKQDQALSVNKAMDILTDTLQKTSLYQSQGPAAPSASSYNHSAPVTRQLFRDYLSTCLQVSPSTCVISDLKPFPHNLNFHRMIASWKRCMYVTLKDLKAGRLQGYEGGAANISTAPKACCSLV